MIDKQHRTLNFPYTRSTDIQNSLNILNIMKLLSGYGLINEQKQLVFSETGRYARDYCEIVQTQHPFCEQPDCRDTTLVYWVQTPGSPTVIQPLKQE